MRRLAIILALMAPATASAATKPVIQAHRGGSYVGGKATYAENTMPAFANAAKHGWVLELDVHLTSDGVPVVIHDDTLERTTPCTGKVSDKTLKQFLACRADTIGGGAKTAKKTSKRTPLPTLDAVLRLAKAKKVTVSAELKEFDPTGASANAVADTVRSTGFARSKLVVQSFFPPNLDAARKAMPGVTLAYLTLTAGNAAGIDLAKAGGKGTFVSPQFPIDAAYVARAHAAGLRVVPFTLNTAAEFLAAKAAGVDALITDDPALAQRVLTKK